MELYQLEYFLEVARQRNFTRAAARLNLAQAALSEQVRKLEQELGGALIQRGRRESVLTPAGELLRAHAGSCSDRPGWRAAPWPSFLEWAEAGSPWDPFLR